MLSTITNFRHFVYNERQAQTAPDAVSWVGVFVTTAPFIMLY